MPAADTATLLIHCPDQPGLVHDVTGFIFSHRGNILDLEQHIDPLENLFFMRVEWSLENFTLETIRTPSSRNHSVPPSKFTDSPTMTVPMLNWRTSPLQYQHGARVVTM